MRIPPAVTLFLVVFLASLAANVVGSFIYERLPAPPLETCCKTCPNGHSGKEFLVIETLPPLKWKS
jgi:hypothetical protein